MGSVKSQLHCKLKYKKEWLRTHGPDDLFQDLQRYRKNNELLTYLTNILDVLFHPPSSQCAVERMDTLYFAIASTSVTLKAETVGPQFLCSFLLLVLSSVFGSYLLGRVCPACIQCSFQPQALKHIIINQALALCNSSLLLNYINSSESIHIPFSSYKCLRIE